MMSDEDTTNDEFREQSGASTVFAPDSTEGIVLSEGCNSCLVVGYPSFLPEEDLAVLMDRAQQHTTAPMNVSERAAMERFEARVAEVTGCEQNELETDAKFKYTRCLIEPEQEEEEKGAGREYLGLGLHVDTHNASNTNQRSSKHILASVILYLNSLPPGSGGETVFPNQPKAGGRLLDLGITHTDVPVTRGVDFRTGQINTVEPKASQVLLDAGEEVCRCDATPVGPILVRRSPSGGVGVLPTRGLAVVLYTRHEGSGGVVDPASWHGGATVRRHGAEKVILQKFKMVRDTEPAAARLSPGPPLKID